jgi:quercetin dioxygenase-like cupin family protein
MIIEIDGESNLYQAGDSYFVPENAQHRTLFSKQTVLIDMSDAPDRYRTT